ncbi:MAG: ACT domain-containing protein [Clostridia bacterium]|nr:ACT domain-containing protein [Clostridia bacterium]
MRAIITVIGKDTKGIIAGVSGYLAGAEINILDISQTIMQEYFTMVMLVDLKDANEGFKKISENLDALGEKLSVTIRIQHEDIFNSMHRV